MIKKINIIYFFFYITVLLGLILNEDLLGGSKHDYLFHLKFINLFKEDLFNGIKNFGYNDYATRNSPVFYIIIAFLNNFISLESIRFINSIASVTISLIFYKTLKLHFPYIDKDKLKISSCIFFISPTVRSLSIWPYPIIWSYIFFLFSIYHFLLFQKNSKIKNNYYCFLNLIIASYLNYTFSFFGVFYLIKFIKKNKNQFSLIKLIFFLLIFSLPAIFFLFFRDGLYVFGLPDGFSLSLYQTLNFSNKIAVISTIFFLYLIPFLNFQKIRFEFKNLTTHNYLIFLILIFLIILFFEYPFTNSFGGGVFFKLSHILFNNNYCFYIIFIISFFVIFILYRDFESLQIIFILFFLYNLQFTIYMKYYDPLIFLIIFFLLKKKIPNIFFRDNYFLYKIYSFQIITYIIFILRNQLSII